MHSACCWLEFLRRKHDCIAKFHITGFEARRCNYCILLERQDPHVRATSA